ncbi:MAG TPA: dienelactone hydrolase family protein [Terriglobia bacterium]|nr:dienelactone hydrolase family protein [Terriglobia bacterium]
MTKRCMVMLLAFVFAFVVETAAEAQSPAAPEIVIVSNGTAMLRALLWRPQGRGPFPAVLHSHGSGRTPEELERLGPYERQADALGPVFARHGYVFMYLFRRGVGLSTSEGANSVDLMERELAARGQDARNSLQLQLLETREMSDALAGLAFLRSLPEVDAGDVAITGDSFGGSLTLLLAEREPAVRAAVVFACAGYSWDRSALLRARLLAAVGKSSVPFFFIHAANDYSVAPGKALDARLRHLGKQHRLKIYPPVGRTAEEGHSFVYLRVASWEPEVFAFLDQHRRK